MTKKDNLTSELAKLLRPYVRRGKFTLSSGGESDMYVDVKAALFDECIQGELWDGWCDHLDTNVVIVGDGYGGYGLAVCLAAWAFADAYVVRSGDDPIGACPPAGAKVVLVDDVYTSGATMRRLERLAQEHGWGVVARFVTVDRSGGHLPENVVAACTLEDILRSG